MARYTGTRGRDEFYGISGQSTRFQFRTDHLDGADIVTGSSALTDIDTLALSRPIGVTGPLVVEASQFDQVRNIEIVRLESPGIELTVSQQLAGSSQRGFLTISGSTGNDVVSGQPNDPSRGPVTTSLVFNANGGTDIFTGGEGKDYIRFGDQDRTGTVLDGRGGFDALVYTGTNSFDFSTLASLASIEGAELRASDGSATLILDDKPFATSDTGAFSVRSYGSDTIDASRVSADNTVIAYLGDGNDTYIGGAGNDNVNASQANTLAVTLGGGDDHFTGVFTRGQLNGGSGNDVLELDFSDSPYYTAGVLNFDFYRYVNNITEYIRPTGFERLIVRASDSGSNFTGGNGNDIFIGGAGLDYFSPVSGFDLLDGGSGSDALNLAFDYAADGVTVAVSSSGPDFSYTVTSSGQTTASGQATSIERISIRDSRFNDVLYGSSGNDAFALRSGGHDETNGGAGSDSVYIHLYDNRLNNGVNFIDQADGVSGVTFIATSGGITVKSGTLTSIEHFFVYGTFYGDHIHSSFASNVFASGGNDIIFITDYVKSIYIFGEAGDDTVALEGSGLEIDLTTQTIGANSIERLDLTGSGDNTLILNDRNVINATDNRDSAFTAAPTNDALVVLGDAGDTLDLRASSPSGSWAEVQSGVGLDGAAGGGFDFWAYTANGSITAFLAVDSDVTVATGGNGNTADAFVAALEAQEAAKHSTPLELTAEMQQAADVALAAPLELTGDLLLPDFFDVDAPATFYSPIHGDMHQPHIA